MYYKVVVNVGVFQVFCVVWVLNVTSDE